MLHVRVIAPPSAAERVMREIRADEAVTHVVLLPGAALAPAGDMIEFDVVREGASPLLDRLRELGIDRDGAIVIERIDTALSAAADRAADRVPGLGVDAVVWHEIEQQTGEEAELSASYLAFMVIAMMIAAIGVLLDQPILIVGSMVVGPEFGPLAALCVGLVQRKGHLIRRSALALGVGFPAGMLVTVVDRDGHRYLVAPYGPVAWVLNARAAGRVTLSLRGHHTGYAVREVGPDEAGQVLKQYIAMARPTRPYFRAAPDAPVADFVAEADRHPVFELTEATR